MSIAIFSPSFLKIFDLVTKYKFMIRGKLIFIHNYCTIKFVEKLNHCNKT